MRVVGGPAQWVAPVAHTHRETAARPAAPCGPFLCARCARTFVSSILRFSLQGRRHKPSRTRTFELTVARSRTAHREQFATEFVLFPETLHTISNHHSHRPVVTCPGGSMPMLAAQDAYLPLGSVHAHRRRPKARTRGRRGLPTTTRKSQRPTSSASPRIAARGSPACHSPRMAA